MGVTIDLVELMERERGWGVFVHPDGAPEAIRVMRTANLATAEVAYVAVERALEAVDAQVTAQCTMIPGPPGWRRRALAEKERRLRASPGR